MRHDSLVVTLGLLTTVRLEFGVVHLVLSSALVKHCMRKRKTLDIFADCENRGNEVRFTNTLSVPHQLTRALVKKNLTSIIYSILSDFFLFPCTTIITPLSHPALPTTSTTSWKI